MLVDNPRLILEGGPGVLMGPTTLLRTRPAAVTLLQTELIAGLAHSFPDAVAWRNLADGTELTLATGTGSPIALPAGCRSWVSARGDRVGLIIGDDEPLEWLVSYLGIHKSGAVAVPLLARLGPAELPGF